MVRFARPFWVEHEGCPIFTVDSSPDGIKFVTGGGDGKVRIWNSEALLDESITPKLYGIIKVSTVPVNICRFSPDGTILAIGGDDKTVSLWKSEGMKDEFEKDEEGNVYCEKYVNIGNLRGHVQEITDLCWCPDGKYLASSSSDNTVTIWDVAKLEIKDVFRGHNSSVFGVAWDPINEYMISMDVSKVIVWDCKSLEEVTVISDVFKKSNHGNFSSRISWSPDGKNIVVGSGVSKRRHVALLIKRNSWVVQLLTAHLNEVICTRYSPELYSFVKESKGKSATKAKALFVTAGMGGDCCVWESKSDVQSICLITDAFDNSIQDATWIFEGKMVIFVGLEGFLACLQFSNEEINGKVLKGAPKKKLIDKIFKDEKKEAEKERKTRKTKKELKQDTIDAIDSQVKKEQKMEEEPKENKEIVKEEVDKRKRTNEERGDDKNDGLTEDDKKRLELMGKPKLKEIKRSTSKAVELKKAKRVDSSLAIKEKKKELDQIIEVKKDEVIEEVKENKDKALEKERAERLERIEKMEFNKNLKKLDKIDRIEDQIMILNEKIGKIEWEKLSQKVRMLESFLDQEKPLLLEQPVIKTLMCNARDESGAGLVIRSTPTTYGKKMYSYLRCIKIFGDQVLWESPLPYELVILNNCVKKIVGVSKENVVILIDPFSGSICNIPIINNGLIHNAFYNNNHSIIVECDGFVKLYDNQMKLIKIINIQSLVNQFKEKKITNIQITNINELLVTFDEEIDVIVYQGNYTIVKHYIEEDEKRRNITVLAKRKVELEISLIELFNHWDPLVFTQIIDKYFDALKQTKDLRRAKSLIETLNQLKLKFNEQCIDDNLQIIMNWLTENGMGN